MISEPTSKRRFSLSRLMTYSQFYWSKLIFKIYMRSVASVVKSAMMHLLTDVSPDSSLSDFRIICQRVDSEGISFITKTLPVLGRSLDQGLESGAYTLPSQFFGSGKNRKFPKLLGALFVRVFNEDGQIKSEPSHESIKAIRQICYYAYKADFPRKISSDLAFIERFKSTEKEIKSYDFSCDDPILGLSRLLTVSTFNGYNRSRIIPFDGPGATSTSSLYDKSEKRLASNLPIYEKFGSDFFFSKHDGMDRLDRYPISRTFDFFKSNVTAEIVLVNKDSRGPRVISKEPYENMYVQQGIRKFLEECMYNHPISSGHINFDDQSINQILSKKSSLDRSFATLDLKDASDRVSLSLVKVIFGGCDDLLLDILACRSSATRLPDGTILPLAKFAPMGSALCFPILSWTCYIVALASLIGKGLSFQAAKSSLYVYGDDIIVSTEHAQYISKVLERYGLKVNMDKSFIHGHFRESCGADYYNGTNVTPVRLRKVYEEYDFGNRRSHKRAALYVWHAQELFSKSLFNTAEYFYMLAEEILGKLPYGLPNAPYLCRTCKPDELLPFQEWYASQPKSGSLTQKTRFSAYVTLPIKRVSRSTVWGHLLRVHRQIGVRFSRSPNKGVFSEPKSWKVVKRTFNMESLHLQLNPPSRMI